MAPVIIGSKHGTARLQSASFRSERPGPEAELVDRFLATARIRVSRGCRVTIFVEPKLGTCYPDIVLVAWRPSVTRSWREERQKLQRTDLRVLQYLCTVPAAVRGDLSHVFGTSIKKCLVRLENAGLITQVGNHWEVKPLTSIFAAVDIVAIEAKMTNVSSAIQQAFLNRWFASKSYVLVPSTRPTAKSSLTAKARGVGILNAHSRILLRRGRMRPVSYASWQFNEWVWRASLGTH